MRGLHRSALAFVAVCCFLFQGSAAGSQAPQRATRGADRPSAATLSPQEVFQRVSPSVVVVESLDAKGAVVTLGSGVVIAPGRVVTNRHVVEDGVSFRVEHGGKQWPAKLAATDPDHDLAELSVAGLEAPVVHIRDSSTLAVGESVYAIGAPEGMELTISEGLISGLRDFGDGRVIQTSAAISPGSSGGGLFDAVGRLVGITTFYLKGGQNLNFALPAGWIASLPKRANATAKTARATGKGKLDLEMHALVLGLAQNWQGLQGASQELIRREPGSDQGWYYLGEAYCGLAQYSNAVTAEEHALRLKPDDEGAWYEMGEAYHGLNQLSKALGAEQEAVRLKPDYERAWLSLGDDYQQLGEDTDAASAYQQAEIVLRSSAGRVDKLTGAAASVKASLAALDAPLWTELGADYDVLGRYHEAIEADQEAVRLNPSDADAWCDLGGAYIELVQPGKALVAEQEAIRIKPDDEDAWRGLGVAYGGLEQWDKAISAELQALRLKPDDATAWFALGSAFRFEGQQGEVVKVYQKLKSLDPAAADKFFKQDVLPQ